MKKAILLALLILAVTVLPLSDVSWAKPKGTYLLCKCTCTAEDELGKPHYGPSNGYWFTTSGGQCLGKKCKVGNLEGSTRDCLFTEHSENVRIPPGTVQGDLQQAPTTPGGMPGPTTGTILRRGIEGGQPGEPTDAGPTIPANPSPETK
jgi:hypothetical protein